MNRFNRRHILKAMTGLALCPACAASGLAADGPHWSYEGATGPDKWGSLGGEGNVCATGTQQSPVDVASTIRAELPKLELAWAKSADTIVNNGHTIELEFHDGGSLKVGGDSYKLVQFHFHHPSEHLVDGKRFAMEAHFVHAGAAGGLAVVGVFIAPGKGNVAFHKIVSTMPSHEGPPVAADAAIDPNGLLPAARTYYAYEGSLTTPPCSETVDWLVMADRIEVAEADIARFAALYPMNARPVQNRNRRFILSIGRR
jgi:carbonic anhydrase